MTGSSGQRIAWLFASILLVSCLVSCGGSSGIYDLSGTVTYDGQPLLFGKIIFEPDTRQGNSGPAGHADIRNGKYDTRQSGRGTTGGPHVIAISGYGEPEMVHDMDADGKMAVPKLLFRRHEQRVAIPATKSAMDFDVPATAAQAAR
jgi:hypothetical protein